MAIQNLKISPDEEELQKAAAQKKRIQIIVSILVVAVVARIFINDPESYKKRDRSQDSYRYIPGVLETMSEETKSKLDPTIIAKFKEADEKYLASIEPVDEWEEVAYAPQEVAPEITEDIEAYKEQVFEYTKKLRKIEEIRKEKKIDHSKIMLVLLKNGGYIKAEGAKKSSRNVDIRFNKAIRYQVPKKLVRSVSQEGLRWKEPLQKGFVELKPARGITISLNKRLAKRITLRKKARYEI